MTEPLQVVFQPRAAREIEQIDAWWQEHRPTSPDLFASELLQALEMIAVVPALGAPAALESLRGVRRFLLRRTQHYVYYRRVQDTVQVLAVWHTARRTAG